MKKDAKSSEFKSIAAQYAHAQTLKTKEAAQDAEPPAQASAKFKRMVTRQKARDFQGQYALLVTFFLWIFFIHATGIYFFTKGFLLTRFVLDFKSECDKVPAGLLRSAETRKQNGCWHDKTFDKAVVLIIDALRYDFTVPIESTEPRHFHNAFPVLYETAVAEPQNSFLLPFIADPPTTTLQRLKGLTTGTLPAFIDAGSNFAGTAIEEDNLIAQLLDANKTLVHLGDDTWQALFPTHFDPVLTRAYDSLNVWDLHTVDNGVAAHILPLLHPLNNTKWDVLVAHVLGVDHAGHRYGPDHPAMGAKLQQMDTFIRSIMAALDPSTLLVVMGDHGMDAKGDHGGESDDEVQAALWMYSQKGVFGRRGGYALPPLKAPEKAVAQIDLVPTLALLLGIPIPFNNLGAPIEEAFIGNTGDDWETLARINALTGSQIHRYQSEYSAARELDAGSTAKGLALWEAARTLWDVRGEATLEEWEEIYAAFSKYQMETLDMCRGLWARFDVPSMIQGIAILAVGLIVLIIYANPLEGDLTDFSTLRPIQILGGSVVGGVLCANLSTLYPDIISFLDASLLGATAGSLLVSIWTPLALRYLRKLFSPLPCTAWGWLSLVSTLLPCIGFASNSFTIWEDEILLFLLATFALFALIASLRLPSRTSRLLGAYHSIAFIVLTRLASLSRLCREEQMPWCRSTFYASATSSTSAPWHLLVPFAIALFLPGVIRAHYQREDSYAGSAPLWIGYVFRFGLFLNAIFWTLAAADDEDWLPSLPEGVLKSVRTLLAQFVLALSFAAGTATFIWAGPCLSLSPLSPARKVTLSGAANAAGGQYFLLVSSLALGLLLVQKPLGAGALALFLLALFSLLTLIPLLSLHTSAIGPTALALLGSLHFFKTGHQATLASIQWDAAFVPLHTIRYPWSPLLLVLNTFGAQILAAAAVPLLALWMRPPGKANARVADVGRAAAGLLVYFASAALAAAVCAAWLRRHLMLYRVFSPRFLMGAMALLVVDAAVVLFALLGGGWSVASAAAVFGF
ncbi:MAG: mannose-ethanolamine phosphotransferase gpi13 [Trizodia sp. TS-e1964]|nr:MAG: mannose-ethanolamine phosphotransferase gpi13 [Trizodia sp. TS-e1964]